MDLPAAPPDAADVQLGGLPGRWKILVSVVFGLFMVLLDSTVVNVAFPTLRAAFDASLGATQWVLSVYVLAIGVTTPLAGFLGDRLGTKPVYLGGLALFAVSSFACGFAPSLGWLIAARVLQGIGGGLSLPLGTAQLFRAFAPREQGLALGVFGIAILMAPALGPILGGYLVTEGHWRWIFFANVPIGALALVLGSRWLVDFKRDDAPTASIVSVLLSGIGFGSILYAATRVSGDGWGAPVVLGGFALGLAALVVFAVREGRRSDPLLDLRLFGNATFRNANIVGYVATLALFGAEFLMPLYLQSLRGLSAFDTGLALLPLALAAGVATPLAGRLYDRVGPRPLVAVGYVLLIVNTWQFAHLTATTPMRTISILLAVRGLALGMTVQTTLTTALGIVGPRQVARASSLVNSTRFVVQALAVAVLSTVLVSTLSPEVAALQDRAMAHHGATAGATSAGVDASSAGAPVAGPVATEATPPGEARARGLCEAMPSGNAAAASMQGRACEESLRGFDAAYTVTFWAAIAAFLFGLTLPGWPGPWGGREGLREA